MAALQQCCGLSFWLYLLIIVGLVLFAGLMSGLTLGLMSMGLVDLEVLIRSGTAEDRKHAAKILPVVKNQHLLLCTLLIGNAIAMEALPIFLDSLVSSYGAILISVTLILMFGEIFPQAICSRYGLAVGAFMIPVVRLLVLIFFPVSYPISKLLDKLLGKGHVALFRRAELKTLVDMHGNEAGKGGELTHDETTIIAGALELTEKTAEQAMTPISSIFAVDVNAKLDLELMNLIMAKGHSRIPVYSGNPANIIGLILVKNLLAIRPQDEVPVRNLTIRKIPRFLPILPGAVTNYVFSYRFLAEMVPESMPLYDILNEFQKGHSHMAVVVKYSNNKSDSMQRSRDLRVGRTLSSKRQSQRRSVDSKGLTGASSYKFLAIDIPAGQSPQTDTLSRRNSIPEGELPQTDALSRRNSISVGNATDQSGCATNNLTRLSSGIGVKVSLLSTARVDGETVQTETPQVVSQRSKKRENVGNENILEINPESLLSFPNDEEVVGIITMEDLIEELLQEEILDETDEYIDVHNKIKVNLLPPGGRSPASQLSSSLPPTATSSFPQTAAPTSPLSSPLQIAPVSTPTWSSAPGSPSVSVEQNSGTPRRPQLRTYLQDDSNGRQNRWDG